MLPLLKQLEKEQQQQAGVVGSAGGNAFDSDDDF
jgi:hypothetical protein